jgi:hypothetical protein
VIVCLIAFSLCLPSQPFHPQYLVLLVLPFSSPHHSLTHSLTHTSTTLLVYPPHSSDSSLFPPPHHLKQEADLQLAVEIRKGVAATRQLDSQRIADAVHATDSLNELATEIKLQLLPSISLQLAQVHIVHIKTNNSDLL